jgi:heme-degrading monooxygenase HmoA
MNIRMFVLCLAGLPAASAAFGGAAPAIGRSSFSSSASVTHPRRRIVLAADSSSTTTTADDKDRVVDDESALTDAGLLKRDRYVATNRFAVRQNQQAKFEQRWARRKSQLATLPGFCYFQLLRRVTLGADGSTAYDAGETRDEAMENYISFTVWEKKSHFNAWRTGPAFVEAHGGKSLGAFVSTMVNSALVLRGAPRPAFYDGLLWQSSPPREVPETVNGWRTVHADGEATLAAESFVSLAKYHIPVARMGAIESAFAAAKEEEYDGLVARSLLRRDARAKGHGIKEMTAAEPSYVVARVFDSLVALQASKHATPLSVDDDAFQPETVEYYEGTLVITRPEGA